MQKLVLASNNAGKYREFQHTLKPAGIELISQADFNVPSVEETGLTFVENAILKARHAAKLTKLAALADDSGLEVPALNGEPGIHSARYASEQASDSDNIHTLLNNMVNLTNEQRNARFVCVLVLMRHANDPTPIVCQGFWSGSILTKPQGNSGFGYDPIFYVPSQHCSAAELDPSKKNQLSHRGQALQQLLQQIQNL